MCLKVYARSMHHEKEFKLSKLLLDLPSIQQNIA